MIFKQMKLSSQKGFTLIELMIVVAIIGILAAIALPSYQNYTRRSAQNACIAEATAIARGMATAIGSDDIALWPNINASACTAASYPAAPATIAAAPANFAPVPTRTGTGAAIACATATGVCN